MRARLCRLLLAVVGLAALHAQLGETSAVAEIVPNPDPSLIAVWQPCEPDTGVTVMVSFDRLGDHKVHVRCALGNQPSGVAALQNAGFALEGTLQYGLGFICRIEGFPTPAEEDCLTTPGGNEYWIYLKGRPGGRFAYSGAGAATVGNEPRINSVEGWAFQGMPVQPMDGRGPGVFDLPPAQPGSEPVLRLAQRWLTQRLEDDLAAPDLDSDTFDDVLAAVTGMQRAGRSLPLVGAADLFADAEDSYIVGPGEGVDPERLANLILAVRATGGDVTQYGGVDLREKLLATIRPSGSLLTPIGVQALPNAGALMLEALARTGPLTDPRLPALLTMIEDNALSDAGAPAVYPAGLIGLVQAQAHGLSSPGIEAFLGDQVDDFLAHQEADGGIRRPGDPSAPKSAPTVGSTAAGALLFAATGHLEEAIRAARWLSQYQLLTEYVGGGDPSLPAPAAGMVGAFVPTEDAMRDMILNGPSSDSEALATTMVALPGVAAAAPYGLPDVEVVPPPNPPGKGPTQPAPPVPGSPFMPSRTVATPAGRAEPVRKAGRVGPGGIAPLARVICPSGGSSCGISVKRRPAIRIGGGSYVATVLGPTRLKPGAAAILQIKLPRAAASRLRGRTATLSLLVGVQANGKRASQRVEIKLRLTGP